MLNDDWYKMDISFTPLCGCGNMNETSDQFLLHCPNYYNARIETFENIDATCLLTNT